MCEKEIPQQFVPGGHYHGNDEETLVHFECAEELRAEKVFDAIVYMGFIMALYP